MERAECTRARSAFAHCVFDVEQSLIIAQDCRIPLQDRHLVTVVPPTSNPDSLADHITAFVNHALQLDDVFCPDFLSLVLVLGDTNKELEVSLPASWNCSRVHSIQRNEASGGPAPGPYLLDNGTLSPIWRLYDDTANAFSLPVRPGDHGESVKPSSVLHPYGKRALLIGNEKASTSANRIDPPQYNLRSRAFASQVKPSETEASWWLSCCCQGNIQHLGTSDFFGESPLPGALSSTRWHSPCGASYDGRWRPYFRDFYHVLNGASSAANPVH